MQWRNAEPHYFTGNIELIFTLVASILSPNNTCNNIDLWTSTGPYIALNQREDAHLIIAAGNDAGQPFPSTVRMIITGDVGATQGFVGIG